MIPDLAALQDYFQSLLPLLQGVWKSLVPLAIITTGIVTGYKFLYKRPELILEVELSSTLELSPADEGDVEAGLLLLLANVGNSSAEEVQLTITADAFHFDNDIDSTDSITSDYEVPQALTEIRSGKKSGFVGGGRRHDIYIENVVYKGDVQDIWLGPAIFDEGDHDLIYQVSCKQHGPRSGRISFHVEDGDVVITGREYPTCRRRWKTRIFGRVERKRTQELENVDADDIEFTYEVN